MGEEKIKSRRGVSEIVASLIVLLIVSVMGVMLYNLSLSTMGSQQDALTFNTNFSKTIAQQRFEIITVTKFEKDGGSYLNVTFYNYGPVEIKITDIYISNSTGIAHYRLPVQANESGQLFTPSPNLITNNGKLLPSRISYIIVDVSKILIVDASKPHQITSCKIVSEEGVTNEIKVAFSS
jgi:hypothetical protein